MNSQNYWDNWDANPSNQKEEDYSPEEMLLEEKIQAERRAVVAEQRAAYQLEKLKELAELTSGNLSVKKIEQIKKIVEPYKSVA